MALMNVVPALKPLPRRLLPPASPEAAPPHGRPQPCTEEAPVTRSCASVPPHSYLPSGPLVTGFFSVSPCFLGQRHLLPRSQPGNLQQTLIFSTLNHPSSWLVSFRVLSCLPLCHSTST